MANPSNMQPIQYLGIRKCPSAKYQGYLFYISDNNRNVLITSPSETIPFYKEDIPDKVLKAFEEAINCHSNSYFIILENCLNLK